MDSDGSSDLSCFTQRNPVLPLREKASVNFRSRDCCLSPQDLEYTMLSRASEI